MSKMAELAARYADIIPRGRVRTVQYTRLSKKGNMFM